MNMESTVSESSGPYGGAGVDAPQICQKVLF